MLLASKAKSNEWELPDLAFLTSTILHQLFHVVVNDLCLWPGCCKHSCDKLLLDSAAFAQLVGALVRLPLYVLLLPVVVLSILFLPSLVHTCHTHVWTVSYNAAPVP